MKLQVRSFAAALLCATLIHAAVRGDHAAFVGGTVTSVPRDTQGNLSVDGKQDLTFIAKEGSIRIPYASITDMEFGQKVGRRVGATVALGVTTLGIGALPVLFSKKKKHFLTVSYQQVGSNEVAVFELAKDIVKTVLPTLEARTGKKILHEGTPGEEDHARKQSKTVQVVHASAEAAVPAVVDKPAQPTGALAATTRATPMTNDDVMKMTGSGVSQDVVLMAIRSSEPHFNLTPSYMNQLLKAGVSEGVIKAMSSRQNGR
jgi:hypothetical protein